MLKHQYIIFDPNAADVPILIQYLLVNIVAMYRVFQIWLDDKFTKISVTYNS